jgi:hypothetical protein
MEKKVHFIEVEEQWLLEAGERLGEKERVVNGYKIYNRRNKFWCSI